MGVRRKHHPTFQKTSFCEIGKQVCCKIGTFMKHGAARGRDKDLNRVHFENRGYVGPQSGNAPYTAPLVRTARLRFPNWTRFRSG